MSPPPLSYKFLKTPMHILVVQNRTPVILLQQISSLFIYMRISPPPATSRRLTQVQSGSDSPERFSTAERYDGAIGQGGHVRGTQASRTVGCGNMDGEAHGEVAAREDF
jgi:hypothetical protein